MAAYNVILLMRHPDIDPGEVTREFGLTPHVAFRKGCVRTLQNGKELPGVSRDSRWNHVYRFSMGRRVGEALAQIVTFLEGHKAFIKKLCLHGASFELYVQLPAPQISGTQFRGISCAECLSACISWNRGFPAPRW